MTVAVAGCTEGDASDGSSARTDTSVEEAGASAGTSGPPPVTSGGDTNPMTAGGGSGGDSSTGEVDPGAEACPWILDHDYQHASEAFFEPTQVIRIDLEMSDEDWQFQLDNPDLEEYRPAAVTFCGQRLEGAGMRFKKSTHPNADLIEGYPKNPMVIDVNRFVSGQELRGLSKINLEYGGDMQMVAERMNWDLLAAFGVRASRTNYVELYLNGTYIGVFTNIERVDRDFAAYHFGDNDGQLYKHAYCGTFQWQGPDVDADTDDPRCYAPVPEDSPTDYADLIHVIDVVSNTPDDEFEVDLPTVWNVDAWLPMTAALQVMAIGDTPNANANNFYTYHPATPGPAEVALWDLDGGYWRDGKPCEGGANSLDWGLFRIAACYDTLPLFDRVMEVDAWRDRYLEHARAYVDGPFDPPAFAARVDEFVEQLSGPLGADPNRSGDDAEWAADVAHVKDRQQQRADGVRAQLDELGVP